MHLNRIEHTEKHTTRKIYLNSLQALLMALHPSKNPEQKSLYLEKYRILIQVECRNSYVCVEIRFLLGNSCIRTKRYRTTNTFLQRS